MSRPPDRLRLLLAAARPRPSFLAEVGKEMDAGRCGGEAVTGPGEAGLPDVLL